MVKRVDRVTISEKDPFKDIRDSAVATDKDILALQAGLKLLNEELSVTKKEAAALKSSVQSTGKGSSADIEKRVSAQKEALKISREAEALNKIKIQTENQIQKRTRELTIQEASLLEARKKANAEARLAARINFTAEGSLDQQRLKLNQARAAWDALSASERENSVVSDQLLANINELDASVKKLEQSSGRHQRNVGNYSIAYNGLGNSISQVAREVPAFTNSMQTGFLAISNNLPILFDEITRVKQANADLIAQGKPVTSVFKQIGSALFSLPMGLNLFVIGLTILGPKIAEWISGMTGGGEAAKRAAEEKKRLNEEVKKSRQYIANESSELVGNIRMLAATNKGSKERSELISKINKEYGTHIKNIKDEISFQQQLNQIVSQFLAYKKVQYQLMRYDDAIKQNLKTQEKLRTEIAKTEKDILFQGGAIDEANGKFDSYGGGLGQISLSLSNLNEKLRIQRRDLLAAELRLQKYGVGMLDLNSKMGDFGPVVEATTSDVKVFNTEVNTTNEYLSKQRELLEELDTAMHEFDISELQQESNDELKRQIDQARTTGIYDLERFRELQKDKSEIQKSSANERARFELESIDIRIKKEIQAEIDAAKEKRDELLVQDEITDSARKEIQLSYERDLKVIEDNSIKRISDGELEKELIRKKSVKDIKEINEELRDFIESGDKEALAAYKDYIRQRDENADRLMEEELKRIQEQEQLKRDIYDLTTEFFINRSERRIAQIDKEIAAAEKESSKLEELAKNGNITAKESLAEQQRLIAEANQKRIQEQKRIELLKLGEVAYSTYSQKVESGSKTPFVDTVKDLTRLREFIKSLSSYYDGTEDTGAGGGLDGKGGFFSILHPRERIVAEKENKLLNGIPNSELPDAVQTYQALKKMQINGKSLRGIDSAGNSFDIMPLISEIKDLKKVVKDKPETNFDVNSIGRGIVELTSSVKKGNDLICDRYIIKT